MSGSEIPTTDKMSQPFEPVATAEPKETPASTKASIKTPAAVEKATTSVEKPVVVEKPKSSVADTVEPKHAGRPFQHKYSSNFYRNDDRNYPERPVYRHHRNSEVYRDHRYREYGHHRYYRRYDRYAHCDGMTAR